MDPPPSRDPPLTCVFASLAASHRLAAAPAYRGAMTTLRPGDPAPAFALSDQHGDTVRLESFRGRKVLVYFYPEADTPGCTRQSCDVRDHRTDLAGIGVDVVGVSPDAPGAQLAFDRKYRLGFPLLADEDLAVAEAWGAWARGPADEPAPAEVTRSAFLVDEGGLIERAWYGVKPAETVPNALAALDARERS
jgi:thioredoxin-dependent peroxiredoxin